MCRFYNKWLYNEIRQVFIMPDKMFNQLMLQMELYNDSIWPQTGLDWSSHINNSSVAT